MTHAEWPLYEVFIRSKQGLAHRHVGSLHAADDQMALENARDAYTRRSEGCSIWVVQSSILPTIKSTVIPRSTPSPTASRTCRGRP